MEVSSRAAAATPDPVRETPGFRTAADGRTESGLLPVAGAGSERRGVDSGGSARHADRRTGTNSAIRRFVREPERGERECVIMIGLRS